MLILIVGLFLSFYLKIVICNKKIKIRSYDTGLGHFPRPEHLNTLPTQIFCSTIVASA